VGTPDDEGRAVERRQRRGVRAADGTGIVGGAVQPEYRAGRARVDVVVHPIDERARKATPVAVAQRHAESEDNPWRRQLRVAL
jgi:hypothetical protein